MSKASVARRMGVSVHTVDMYIKRARVKYAQVGRPAPTKTDMLARAIEDGLVTPAELAGSPSGRRHRSEGHSLTRTGEAAGRQHQGREAEHAHHQQFDEERRCPAAPVRPGREHAARRGPRPRSVAARPRRRSTG